MQLILYENFAKKINSTKRPDETVTSYTVDVSMKQDTSLENPVFFIDGAIWEQGLNLNINYCKWEDHYYFIDNIVVGNNYIYELQCTMDSLATWKEEIGASTQYILRGTNTNAIALGTAIPDPMYTTKPYSVEGQTKSPEVDSDNPAPAFDTVNGMYILGFIGSGPTFSWQASSLVDYRGGTAYMLMTQAQAKTFMDGLLNLTSEEADVQPKDYITSLIYLPYHIDVTGQPVMTYTAGIPGASFTFDYTSVASLDSISRGIYTTNDTEFDLIDHPDVTTRGRRMNLEPYTRLLFHGGPYGDITIPNDIFYNQSAPELIIKQKIDLCTGVGVLRFYTRYNGAEFMRVNGQIGLNIRVSQIYTRSKAQDLSLLLGLAGSLGKTVGQALSNDLGGAASTTVGALGDTIMGIYTGELPKVSSNGSNESIIDLIDTWTLEYLWHKPLDEDLIDIGRPVYARLKISDYPGYIQCNSFRAEIPCHLSEYQQIEQYANSGFYYE